MFKKNKSFFGGYSEIYSDLCRDNNDGCAGSRRALLGSGYLTILAQAITYSTDKNFAANLITISTKRAFEVIGLNKKGVKPESLDGDNVQREPKRVDLLDQDSVTRFDSAKKKKKKKKPAGKGGNPNRDPKRPSGNNEKQG